MSKDIHGRTRSKWFVEWAMWWLLVAIFGFLFFQLSRPLWDADNLIAEKRQSCENAGLVMIEEKVKFGTNYFCAASEQQND